MTNDTSKASSPAMNAASPTDLSYRLRSVRVFADPVLAKLLVAAADELDRLAAPVGQGSATSGETDIPALFEAWAKDPIRANKLPLEQHPNGAYTDTRSYLVCYDWKNGYRAALAASAEQPDSAGSARGRNACDLTDYKTPATYSNGTGPVAERAAAPASPILARTANLEGFYQSEPLGYAQFLAWIIWRDNYKEDSPDFEILGYMAGVLAQIDNMVSGLGRKDAAPASVPDGYKLVPIEPTDDMRDAPQVSVGGCYSCSAQQVSWGECSEIYKAMVAAAPEVALPAAQGELPEMPTHPEPHTYRWTQKEIQVIQEWGASQRQEGRRDMHETQIVLVGENCTLLEKLRTVGTHISTGYESGTMISDPTGLGATIRLHYESTAEAEIAFNAITDIIGSRATPAPTAGEPSARTVEPCMPPFAAPAGQQRFPEPGYSDSLADRVFNLPCRWKGDRARESAVMMGHTMACEQAYDLVMAHEQPSAAGAAKGGMQDQCTYPACDCDQDHSCDSRAAHIKATPGEKGGAA